MMDNANLDKAMEIFALLIVGEEVSSAKHVDLYEEYRNNSEVYDILTSVLKKSNSKLLVTGGGAFNEYLINRLKFYAPNTTVVLGSNELIEFKEAIIFAFLGVLRIKEINNVLSSVTGASKDHCSGVVYW